jgi:hypothetical protein
VGEPSLGALPSLSGRDCPKNHLPRIKVSPKEAPTVAIPSSGLSAITARSRHEQEPNVQNVVRLERSATHDFRYVNVTDDDGELVVYGKIEHSHIACKSEGHVDLAVVNGDAAFCFAASRRRAKPQPSKQKTEVVLRPTLAESMRTSPRAVILAANATA